MKVTESSVISLQEAKKVTIQRLLSKIVACHDLDETEAGEIMKGIIDGSATEAQIGSLLIALRMKGETSREIASFARVIRSFATTVSPKINGTLVDTCGTGGDGSQSFNISTAAAFVAAGAGVPIVKHGNRSITSTCGSADVLEELGVELNLEPDEVKTILEKINIVFLYAPNYHPALKHATGPRRELGVRTIFNLLGPLVNPAGAQAQLIGVYSQELTEKIADVLRYLGLERAMVVHGNGLDEISTTGPTSVAELKEGTIRTYTIHCEDFGFCKASIGELKGGNAKTNARILREVLCGMHGAARDIVLLNAGAAIYLGGKCAALNDGIALAAESIDSGKAYEKLEMLIEETRDLQCC
jgi:anthranilate phosphoribosyltransferase